MQQRLLSWLVLEVALADFCPTLRVSGRDVTDVLFQMRPISHALMMMAMILTKPTQRGKPDHKRQVQHGVEGGAPHRAEAFVAIQYEDAGKKANLHLQTSQPQTKGHADRPDAQTVCQSNHISKWRQPRKSPRGVGRKKIWCPLLLYLVLLVVLVFFGVLLRLPAPLAPLPLAFGGADQ